MICQFNREALRNYSLINSGTQTVLDELNELKGVQWWFWTKNM